MNVIVTGSNLRTQSTDVRMMINIVNICIVQMGHCIQLCLTCGVLHTSVHVQENCCTDRISSSFCEGQNVA